MLSGVGEEGEMAVFSSQLRTSLPVTVFEDLAPAWQGRMDLG